jgi:hypothetical protein
LDIIVFEVAYMAEINFSGISDIITSTTAIIPDLIDLIVAIAPLKIVQALVYGVVGLIIGIVDIGNMGR